MSGASDEQAYEARAKALSGNPDVEIQGVEVLSDDWYTLRKVSFTLQVGEGDDAETVEQSREAYDRGNGAAILLYDPQARTVLLTRQFRMPAYLNHHPDGMMLEVPAGLIDDDDPSPESTIRRETTEETGLVVGEVETLWPVFTSPGSVTETLALFAAPYSSADRAPQDRGGHDEGEDIEIVELGFDEALAQLGTGIVDAKTIVLLLWAAREGRIPA